jgi:hypothetical protein
MHNEFVAAATYNTYDEQDSFLMLLEFRTSYAPNVASIASVVGDQYREIAWGVRINHNCNTIVFADLTNEETDSDHPTGHVIRGELRALAFLLAWDSGLSYSWRSAGLSTRLSETS